MYIRDIKDIKMISCSTATQSLGVTDIDTVTDFHNIANCVVKEQWLLPAKTKESTTQTVTKDSAFLTCQLSTWPCAREESDRMRQKRVILKQMF